MVVVVLVVVSVLELVLLIIWLLSRVVREVRSAWLKLGEGPLIYTLVMLSALLFIARIVLVRALGLHLGRITSNSRLVMVVVVISATVTAATRVLIFEIAVVLSLTVFGEIALVVGGEL
jgi:hypothetical protein